MLELFLAVFKGLSVFGLILNSKGSFKILKQVVYDGFAEFILSDLLLFEHLIDFIFHFVGNT